HTKNCHLVVNSFHLEFHRVKGGELARLVGALCVNAKLIFPVGAVKAAVAAILRRSGVAAVKVICSRPLLHELFKGPVAAGCKIHGVASFLVLCIKNGVPWKRYAGHQKTPRDRLGSRQKAFSVWL